MNGQGTELQRNRIYFRMNQHGWHCLASRGQFRLKKGFKVDLHAQPGCMATNASTSTHIRRYLMDSKPVVMNPRSKTPVLCDLKPSG
jgi:hypothetical protein